MLFSLTIDFSDFVMNVIQFFFTVCQFYIVLFCFVFSCLLQWVVSIWYVIVSDVIGVITSVLCFSALSRPVMSAYLFLCSLGVLFSRSRQWICVFFLWHWLVRGADCTSFVFILYSISLRIGSISSSFLVFDLSSFLFYFPRVSQSLSVRYTISFIQYLIISCCYLCLFFLQYFIIVLSFLRVS